MKAHTEHNFGYALIIFAYLLGSYFVALLLFLAGAELDPGSLLNAPIMFPSYLAIGLLLTGDGAGLIEAMGLWAIAVVGCWGLLRSLVSWTFSWWPFLLLIVDALLFVLFVSYGPLT